MDEKIALAGEFTKQCLLPELDREIGSQQIERDDFNLFVYGLEQNLRLLFDMVAKGADTLFKVLPETETFRIQFVLLLNEQLAGPRAVPFQTLDPSLQSHLRKLFEKYYRGILSDKKTSKAVLELYKSKLTAEKWKKNLGAIYGYDRFCEVRIELNPVLFRFNFSNCICFSALL